jgi:phosphate transport system substrate-binding protein
MKKNKTLDFGGYMIRNAIYKLSTLVIVTIILTACSGQTTTPAPIVTESPSVTQTSLDAQAPEASQVTRSANILPMVDPAAFNSDIIVSGSSTVYPLAEAMAIRFNQEGFPGNITIDSIGTGAGFERFCTALESDIATASRPIKQEELDLCRANGREPIGFRVGTDAIAFVVSKDNTFLANVTTEQLALIFSTATLWSDIDPSWPAEPIQRFSPGTDSGTFDYLVELLFAKDEAPLLNASNLQLSEDDNVLVQGVEGSPYAIGFFGYAYYQENSSRLTALSVNGVTPNEQTAEDNTYSFSRPLFIYSDADIMQQKPQVAAFINFFLTYVNEEILAVGYFPASQDAINQSMQAWVSAIP